MAAGLQHHGSSGGEEPIHQRVDVFLEQRLAAGNLHQRRSVRLDGADDLVHGHLVPLVERVRRVAPAAAEVAGGQPDEHAELPRARRLALDRMKNLVDRQHRRFLLSYRYGQADVLYQAHLNDLQKCQKFSGYGRRRGEPDRHQHGAAHARVPGEAHRPGALPRFRQYAQPGVQDAAATGLEAGSDCADDGEPEPDPAADPGQGLEDHLRLRQGPIRPPLTCASGHRAGITRRARAPGTASSIRRPAAVRRGSTSSRSTPSTSIRWR